MIFLSLLQKEVQEFPSVEGLGFGRVMRTFPCCKSLLCVTTSLGNHTQQTSSSHLFNVNRKNKSRLWRMVERRNIWLTLPLQLITATLKTRKNTATRLQPDLVPPPSFSILEILWMENVGLSKASWISPVVLPSSFWSSSVRRQHTDRTSKCTLSTQ